MIIYIGNQIRCPKISADFGNKSTNFNGNMLGWSRGCSNPESRKMVKGSVITLARRCGKTGCKCNRGEKHKSKYLSISDGGKTRMIYLKPGMEMKVGEAAERYRGFRSARVRLVKTQKEVLNLFNQLEDLQREELNGKRGKKKSKG